MRRRRRPEHDGGDVESAEAGTPKIGRDGIGRARPARPEIPEAADRNANSWNTNTPEKGMGMNDTMNSTPLIIRHTPGMTTRAPRKRLIQRSAMMFNEMRWHFSSQALPAGQELAAAVPDEARISGSLGAENLPRQAIRFEAVGFGYPGSSRPVFFVRST